MHPCRLFKFHHVIHLSFMCGITVGLRSNVSQSSDAFLKSVDWLQLVESNAARGRWVHYLQQFCLSPVLWIVLGPDSQCVEDVVLPVNSTERAWGIEISFVVSTLHLRGATLVRQPHTSEKSILCWNGEVWS